MQYDKYSDQLLAKQDFIRTNIIFEILLDYIWHELSYDEARLRAQGHPGQKDLSFWEVKVSTEEAYTILKGWIGSKFHDDPSGSNLCQLYRTVVFFDWIIADDILGKLEAQVEGFKIPDRAREFVGYVRDAITEATPTTKPEPTQSEPETPPAGKDDGRGAKLKQDWWALGKLTVSLWKASGRTLKPAEIYDHADYQEALSKGKIGSREYVIKHRIGPAIKGKREVKVKTKNPSKPTNKGKLGLTHVGDQLKKTKGRK